MKKGTFFILLLLFFIGFFLRSYLLKENLFFGPEQGRDFLVIKQIVIDHKLTLIGSKTDIDGVFHGPIFYYLASLPFLISYGDPLSVSLFFIFLNSLTVFFLFDLGKSCGSKRLGYIAAILFTISWSAIVYSRWLSNPPLSIPLAALFFALFYRFLKGSKWSLICAAIAFGLLNQAEFLNILFFFLIAICLIIFYFPSFRKQNLWYLLLCGLLAFFTSVGTYILFDIKHQFLITKNILLLLKGGSGYHINWGDAFISTVSGFFTAYKETIFSFSPFALPIAIILIAGVILLFVQKIITRQKMYGVVSVALIIPPLILFGLRHAILDQFFVALLPLFILATAILIDFFWQKFHIFGIILFGIIILGNLSMWSSNVPRNKNIFFQSTQPDLRYSDQLATIDTIYKEAQGKKFSFQSYTIPYWEQQAWQYLFWQYGEKKYGYLPVTEKADRLFVIIQNDPSNLPFQQDWLKNTVSKWGKVTKTFRHGVLTIEELKVENI